MAANTFRLGDHLIARGLLNADQLEIALREQRETRLPLGEQLIRLGFVTPEQIRDVLADSLGEKTVDLKGVVPHAQALALVPKNIALRCNAFPISFEEESRTLYVALADTHDVVAIDMLRRHLGNTAKIEPLLGAKSEIVDAINRCYGHELTIDGILKELEGGDVDLVTLAAAGENYAHPVIRLADTLLADAVLRDASDIHFEPEGAALRIRYRIDGVLRIVRTLHITFWPGLLTRLKVLAGMDIAESRAPQDGRITRQVAGRSVDFRCATQPTIYGENFVLRILDKKRALVSLDQLDLSPEHLATLKLMIERPEGILLVTGPTGSGKTTTLYSILGHLNDEGVNIMTLEDPVEYPMMLVRQTQVGETAKIDFASGIRSLMRQDPDIILVGEIRDEDTATLAFRAAMTGHMVFSTLHTNSAVRAIPRLMDLGIQPSVMSGNIIGILAQRLVRKLCVCAEPAKPDEREQRILAAMGKSADMLRHPRGCPRCYDTGYRGRVAIMEILRVDATVDDLIASGASIARIEEAAKAAGFISMAEDGVRKAIAGITTLAEVGRVVDLTRWLMALER